MVIEVLIFFSFVILFLVVGALVAISAQRRRRHLDRTHEEVLQPAEFVFLRRNWFLIVLLILAINPLTIHWMRAGAHKKNYNEQLRRQENTTGSDSSRDSSNHVAIAPNR